MSFPLFSLVGTSPPGKGRNSKNAALYGTAITLQNLKTTRAPKQQRKGMAETGEQIEGKTRNTGRSLERAKGNGNLRGKAAMASSTTHAEQASERAPSTLAQIESSSFTKIN